MTPREAQMALRAALARTTQALGEAQLPSPSADARALLAEAAAATGPLALLDELPGDFAARLETLVERRARHEPLQLILGVAPFRRLQLRVAPGVFIPRPETELAIDLVAEHHRGPLRTAVDLCTGSGALAASLLDEQQQVRVLAVDIDAAAVDLARENLAAAGPGRGEVIQLDLRGDLATLRERAPVDLVLSNPPYIPPDAVPRERQVLEHDPARALYGGGEDGLDLPRAVIAAARDLLRPGGLLIMEHADVQGEQTRQIAAATEGLAVIRTAQDLSGRDRFLLARRHGGESEDESETLSR